MTVDSVITKIAAIFRRGLPTLRNVVYSKFGVWPVDSLENHWFANIPVYCISLVRAEKRRSLIKAQVAKMGLKHFEFIDAVDSRTLSMESLIASGLYDSSTCRRYHTRDLTINEIACSLSHAEAYRMIVERNHPWAVIIEDDALFRTRRIKRLKLDDLPEETDLVFLNAFLDSTPPRDPVAGPLFRDTSYNGSSAAYMVSRSAAERLRAVALPVVHAADGLTGRVLSLPPGASHPFRQKGVSLSMSGILVYPEAVTNGSTDHYHRTSIR